MIGDIYGGKILEAAANIPLTTRLEAPDATSTKVSRICGSQLTLDLEMVDDRVSAVGLDAKACALGQAAASLTVQHIIGASAEALFHLRDDMVAMLKQNGPAPQGERWSDLADLMVIRDYPQRHTSTLLIFEAIIDCLQQMGYVHPDQKAVDTECD